jgi:hypothetical protein
VQVSRVRESLRCGGGVDSSIEMRIDVCLRLRDYQSLIEVVKEASRGRLLVLSCCVRAAEWTPLRPVFWSSSRLSSRALRASGQCLLEGPERIS